MQADAMKCVVFAENKVQNDLLESGCYWFRFSP